jgi:hypothetical protein
VTAMPQPGPAPQQPRPAYGYTAGYVPSGFGVYQAYPVAYAPLVYNPTVYYIPPQPAPAFYNSGPFYDGGLGGSSGGGLGGGN